MALAAQTPAVAGVIQICGKDNLPRIEVRKYSVIL
jgi:hypothetical protein